MGTTTSKSLSTNFAFDTQNNIKEIQENGFSRTASESFCDKLARYIKSDDKLAHSKAGKETAFVITEIIEKNITHPSVCRKATSILAKILADNPCIKRELGPRLIPLMLRLMGTYSEFAESEECITNCCLRMDLNFTRPCVVPENKEKLPIRLTLFNYKKETLCFVVQKLSNILVLDLSPNHMGPEGCGFLASFIERNTSVQFLHLSWNNIGSAGCITLAKSLRRNDTLKVLKLSWNHIGPDGGVAIADMLKDNRTLQCLDLSWNSIGRNGGIAIASSLRINKTLHMINLEGNHLGPEGGIALAHALKTNITLHSVYLLNNKIGAEGGMALAKVLEKNTTLHMFNLSTNTKSDGNEETK